MTIYNQYIPTQKELRQNVLGQGVKILHALMEHYASGDIERDSANDIFMGMIQLVCEGRVKGEFGDNGKILWSIIEPSDGIYPKDNLIPFPLDRGGE